MTMTDVQASILNLITTSYNQYETKAKAIALAHTKTLLCIQQSARDTRTLEVKLPLQCGIPHVLHTFVVAEASKCKESEKILYITTTDKQADFLEFSKGHDLKNSILLTDARELAASFPDNDLFYHTKLVVVNEASSLVNVIALEKLYKRNHPSCFYILVG